MNLHSAVVAALLAVAHDNRKSPVASTTWLVDGDNVLGRTGTPDDEAVLVDRLAPAASRDALELVFDGREGGATERREEVRGRFRLVRLEAGVSTDDYVLERAEEIAATSRKHRVKLVTQDRALRRAALAKRPTVGKVVDPITFWRRYVPRMAGLKKRATPPPAESE